MPLSVLASALFAVLAAQPEPATPTASATPTSTSESEWVTGDEAPPEPAPAERGERRARPPPLYYGAVTREWALAAGWNTTGLMGVVATGTEVRFALGNGRFAYGAPVIANAVLDLFVGETEPGLPVRSLSMGAEVWTDGRRFRVGGGLGAGVVAYRRATRVEWPFLITAGIRAGVEVALFRLGPGDLVLGAHGALDAGPWASGGFSVGYRGRAGSR